MVFALIREKEVPSMARLKRPGQVNVTMSQEQKEYVARKSFEIGLSGNAYIRSRLFRNGWRDELYNLRMSQPEDLRELDPRRR
jgi:hypothetical protein